LTDPNRTALQRPITTNYAWDFENHERDAARERIATMLEIGANFFWFIK